MLTLPSGELFSSAGHASTGESKKVFTRLASPRHLSVEIGATNGRKSLRAPPGRLDHRLVELSGKLGNPSLSISLKKSIEGVRSSAKY